VEWTGHLGKTSKQVLQIFIFMKSSPIDHLLVRESLRGCVADAGGARLTSASPFGSPTKNVEFIRLVMGWHYGQWVFLKTILLTGGLAATCSGGFPSFQGSSWQLEVPVLSYGSN
jgi:hypothetical protein